VVTSTFKVVKKHGVVTAPSANSTTHAT